MKIIKRNGSEAAFDIAKIVTAITKANGAVEEKGRMTPMQIQRIAESVVLACEQLGRSPSVEEVQDMVEHQIMAHGAFEVAKAYITYRYTRSLVRQSNTTDDKILSLIECNNEEAKQENSNKNPVVEFHPAGLYGRRGVQGYHQPHSAAAGYRGGPQRGDHPFPRYRLLRPAYAQLRSGQSGGYAAKRHGDHRHPDRAAPQLFHRLQHRHPDHRPGGLQPVRRPVHLPGPSGALCAGEPGENPSAGAAGAGG